MTDGPITCLIADDQAMVREGFGALLAAQPDLAVVGQAADGADAVRLAHALDPDVILMDVRMPVMDGLEATRRILQQTTDGTTRRVLMLTTFDLDEYVYEALRAGASGFLLKDAPADELVNAVRVVAAGDALVSPSVMRRLIADFVAQPQRPRADPVSLDVLHRVSAKSFALSRAASRTQRSAPPSSSHRRQRRRISAASCTSSTCETAPRPSLPPTSRA